jgi:phospholipid-binding lipoprotein MlaA
MSINTRFFLALALVGCFVFSTSVDAATQKKPAKAKPAPAPVEEEYSGDSDPLAPYNHAMFQINRGFDTLLLRPVTVVYRTITPEFGQEMVSNAVENIYLPVTFANSVLQADPQNSFATFFTFMINSTVGVAGVFDVASEAGLKYRQTDFGQTLAIYGAGSGPYIVLPILGPSNVRDGIGRVADAFMNPFNYIDDGFSLAMWGTTAVDKRSQNMQLIDDIYATSLDPYSTFKSGYTQHRSADIRRAKTARSQSRHSSGLE